MPHLFSGLIAFGLATAMLFAGGMVVIHLEQITLPSTAPELFPLKNQGLAFQHAAARASDVLPLYDSSELIFPPVPEKASSFFRTEPTGFQVSPVGHGGTTSLIVLQKISALGSDFARQKACYLAGARLAFEPPLVARVRSKFFADGGKRDGVR